MQKINKSIIFYFKDIDEENERITFSSSEELRSAISSNQDSNALKIFVNLNNQQSSLVKTINQSIIKQS